MTALRVARMAVFITMVFAVSCGSDAPSATSSVTITDLVSDGTSPDSTGQNGAGQDTGGQDTAGQDTAGQDGTTSDAGDRTDGQDTPETEPHDADAPDVAATDELDATDYCEHAVSVFCPYYVRCGRMAAADLTQCESTFLETCNARYEPIYADLAQRGALILSAAGLSACASHLDTVACDAQLTDLDGPCGQIWRGASSAGSPCGPGIESLVCDPQSTCVLRLEDFCGECTPVVGPNAPCDAEHRCPQTAVCVDGACMPRVQTGEPCTAADTCEVGADCVGQAGATRCLGAELAAVGGDCGAGLRCPYKSVCSGGKCVETSLLGEPCTAAIGCASGSCQGGLCVPLGSAGAPCTTGLDCISSRCGGAKTCQAVGPACP